MSSISEDQLVEELWARDVRFLTGKQSKDSTMPQLDTPEFIAALAKSEDARVRFSLIPLFLRHPEYAADVIEADKALADQTSQLTLRFYYTAAALLQKKLRFRITRVLGKQPTLKDLFSDMLEVLSNQNPDEALVQLGKRHRALTGQCVNWLGTYEHAADAWIKALELQ